MKTSYWVKIIPVAHNAPQSPRKGDNTNSGRFFSPVKAMKTGIIYGEDKAVRCTKKRAVSHSPPDKARDAGLICPEMLKSKTINLLIEINIKSAFAYLRIRTIEHFNTLIANICRSKIIARYRGKYSILL